MYFLGDRIRYLRETRELKQKDMASIFSVNENTWSQYENNKRTPDLETIKKIAEFFFVSIDYLLSLTDVIYDPRDKDFQTIISIYSNLSKQQKEEFTDYIKNKYK